MPPADIEIAFRGQDLASAEFLLILAIVALLALALYDLFPKWRA